MYTRWQKAWEKHIDFILLDLLCMIAAFYLSYLGRHGANIFRGVSSHLYGQLMGVLIFVDLCVVLLTEGYKGVIRRGYLVELKKTVFQCMLVIFIILFYLFLTKQSDEYSREVLLVFCVLWPGATYLVRCIRKHAVRVRMLKNPYVEQMLILTDREYADSCIEKLMSEKYRNYRIAGVVLVGEDTEIAFEIPQLQRTESDNPQSEENAFSEPAITVEKNLTEGFQALSDYLLNHVVDSVFVNMRLGEKELAELSQILIRSGVVVHINLAEMSYPSTNSTVEQIGGFTVMTSGMHIATTRQYFLKRAMDILGGIVGCAITAVVTLFVTPVIWLQSPGPVFFRQQRVGKNGRTFWLYKFRSMYVDAEERKQELMEQNQMEGLMFKMKDDPRMTPVGRFLRRYSIDELPQFFNVLRGDMSLVGTRPPTLDEFEKYQLHHRGRLGFRPGITGLWQVSGRNTITDFEKVVELDTKYIMNWSLGEDVKILWKTVRQVVKGDEGW